MGGEERDPYDARTTRSSRRSDTEPTDRLGASRPPAADPVNPDWRGSRVTRRNRRSQRLPSSRQEFILWLQFGGWRALLAAIVLVVFLIGLIYITRAPKNATTPFGRPTVPASVTGAGGASGTLPPIASPTPGVRLPTSTTVTSPVGGAKFQVVNTGAEGLFLRPDHNTNLPPIKTLPDGSVVTITGPDFSGPDRVWKHVRDAEGAEGWVAADFLQPAP
jgi:hypothetical protein